jgi:co-chaperonin GroES (HSP10)
MTEVYRPEGDRILVKLTDIPNTTEAGLHVPDSVAKAKCGNRGIIVEVGPGPINSDTNERVPIRLEAGDKVMFGAYGTVGVDEEAGLVIVEYASVICRIEDSD